MTVVSKVGAAAVAAALLLVTTGVTTADVVDGYVVSGTPVDGADQQSAAAPLLLPGQYTDELDQGVSGSRYYRVPTPAGSQVRVTAVLPIPLHEVDEPGSVGVELELYDLNGDSCVSTSGTESLTNSGPDFAVVSLSYLIDPEKPCGSRDSLHVRLERTQDGLASIPLPVEITVRLEPAADVDGLPEPVTDEGPILPIPVLDDPEDISGGRTFADAVALTSGVSYRDTLQTGQMRFYRVPMTWGQRLTYLVRDTGPTTPDPDLPETVSVAVFDPLRAPIGHAGDLDSMFNSKSTLLTASTEYPVRYLNRENSGNSRNLSVAGEYYLVVTAMPRDGVSERDGTTTVDLTVVVSGEPDPEPTYRELGLTTSDAEATPSDSTSAGPTSVDPTRRALSEAVSSREPIASSAATGAAPITWWAVGGIVVVVAGVGVVLLRRRRAH